MKTLVWIIGKPGSGKSTVGNFLSKSNDITHFSYGDLLKQTHPNPPTSGYTQADRDAVNTLITEASAKYDVVVVDGNPYSTTGFGFLEEVKESFNAIVTIHLLIEDSIALERLISRNREVLQHDGKTEKDRIQNFNERLLPLIIDNTERYSIYEIDVTNLRSEEVAKKVLDLITRL